ncbi:3'(2'),5'-bisphosphate nucleotidase CysQ [Roseibaca sp. Y0-43]|nr:3'(2'),5'-bisphosphate nucleotidase CysQ [Roseibaca sp. Y0-43]MCC1482545.1 3'(2'),5'-bisphosphate nucleotidase CysQ [Roseibaca sp. Y0-43]
MPVTDDLALVTQAAELAGQIALRHFGRAPRAWDKGQGQGPVSDVDLEIDAALRDLLLGARPDYGWLSEETPDTPDRLNHARIFILDPLDGTRAYLDGQDGFCHPVCVVENGQPVAAAIHVPRLGHTYSAARGQGAFRNGQPIRVGETVAGASALAARSQFDATHWPGGVPDLTRHFRPALAWRMALVAEGAFDAMLTFKPAWHWDIAAGALLVAEAGGAVSDEMGAPLAFNTLDPRATGVIAANPALHAALLARRKSALTDAPAPRDV